MLNKKHAVNVFIRNQMRMDRTVKVEMAQKEKDLPDIEGHDGYPSLKAHQSNRNDYDTMRSM